jgi:hypothetical protein
VITITLDRNVLTAGETVAGTATWQPDRPVNPRAIVISAAWRTEGRGDTSRGHAGEVRFPVGPEGFPPLVTLPFQFVLPPDGPISYDGKIIRILWELVVRIDLPMAVDETYAVPFQVLARGAQPLL